jgi:hypothetical protein
MKGGNGNEQISVGGWLLVEGLLRGPQKGHAHSDYRFDDLFLYK